MIHAATSGSRPVKNPWMMMPVNRMNPGKIQSHTPVTFSVK